MIEATGGGRRIKSVASILAVQYKLCKNGEKEGNREKKLGKRRADKVKHTRAVEYINSCVSSEQ